MSLPKILIVDDEEFVRKSLNEYLSKRLECEIHEAKNGYEAIEKVNSNNIDLILLDIKMPGISGMDVMEKLRASSKDMPIIVLSKFEGDEMDNKIKSYGADYILKPYSLKVVRSKVEEKLKARSQFFPKQA